MPETAPLVCRSPSFITQQDKIECDVSKGCYKYGVLN